MFQPEEIVRDKWGFWCHSVFRNVEEGEDATKIPEAEGMEFIFFEFEDDASDELKELYERGCELGNDVNWEDAIKLWNPSQPEGEGWFLIAIYDTEDGPMAGFARPKPRSKYPQNAEHLFL